ncbi:MAG: hypothetical protein ACOY3I_05530 [Verrucomicrobiota bacterium]
MNYRQVKGWMLWLPLFLLILFWTALYLPRLRTNPGWFIEESVTLDCANNLIKGIPAYIATWNTFFHPVGAHQPGYLLLTGLFAQGDIAGARFFNALLGLAIVLSLYLLGRKTLDSSGAFAAALLFLVYEQSVIHFRSVYSYNGAALGFALTALFLMRQTCRKNDVGASVGLTIAAISHPMFAYMGIAAWAARFQRPRSWSYLFIAPLVYWMLLVGVVYSFFGGQLFQDISALLQSYRRAAACGIWELIQNVYRFYAQDWFHIGAFAGLVCCFPRKYYSLGIVTAIVSLLVLQSRTDFRLYYYPAVPLLPLLALCWGVLVVRINHLFRNLYEYQLALFLVLLLSAFCVGKVLIPIWYGQLKPKNINMIAQFISDNEAAAKWLNAHTKPDDLVIGNMNVGWMLHAQKARYRQTLAWEGTPTFGYERPVDRSRFRYDVSLNRAKYVIVCFEDFHWDPAWRNLAPLFTQLEKEQWPLAWKSSGCSIFVNPNWKKN